MSSRNIKKDFDNPNKHCEICDKEILKIEFEHHMRACDYCDDYFECISIEIDHMIDCGNRTEFCTRCNSYILKKSFKVHRAANNCRRPDLPKKTVQELKDEVKNYIRLYK